MSFEDIVKKIEQEAQQRQKGILHHARLEAEKKKEKAKAETDRECEQLIQQRMKEAQLEVQRMLAEAKLKGRSLLGQVKSEALQKVRENVTAECIKKISQSQKEWYKKIIVSNSVNRDEEIFMAPADADSLGESFIEELNRQEKASFRFGGVTREIDHGMVLKKGGMILNLSIHSLLEDTLRKHESQITEMLFKGEGK